MRGGDPSQAEVERGAARRKALLALGVLWAVVSAARAAEISALTERLWYSNPDGAMAVQRLWNTLRGRPLVDSLERLYPPFEGSLLASHADLSTIVDLPVYALTGSLGALFLWKALLGLAGVFPLFLLAERRLNDHRLAFAVAGLSLANPLLLHNAVLLGAYFGYTPVCVLWALERLEARSWRGAGLAFGLAVATREEVALPVAVFLGATALVDPSRRRFALAVAGASLLWLLLYLKGLQGPVFGGGGHLGRYAHLGGSLPSIALSPVLRPGAFWGHLLSPGAVGLAVALVAPFAPVALLAPRHLAAAAAPWCMVALSAYEGDRMLGRYLVPALPFLLAAVPAGLGAWRERSRRLLGWEATAPALAVVGAMTLLVWLVDAGPLGRYAPVRPLSPRAIRHMEGLVPEHAELCAALSRVPAEAVVSSTITTQVLLAERRWLHAFPVRVEEADVVVVDVRNLPGHWPRVPRDQFLAALRYATAGAARVEQIGPVVIAYRR